MVIEGNRIKDIGSKSLLSEYPHAEVIDLKGKVVVPGLNDTHLHFLMTAEYLTMLPIEQATSITEIIEKARKYIEEKSLSEEDILYTEGWNQYHFDDEQRVLNRWDLDKISTTIPIILVRADRHVWSVNSKVLDRFGLSERTPVPEGGEIRKDSSGTLTGVFTERAIDLIRSQLPVASKAKKKKALKQAMIRANQYGLTSMHTCDAKDNQVEETLSFYDELDQENELTVRFYQQMWFSDGLYLDKFLDKDYACK